MRKSLDSCGLEYRFGNCTAIRSYQLTPVQRKNPQADINSPKLLGASNGNDKERATAWCASDCARRIVLPLEIERRELLEVDP